MAMAGQGQDQEGVKGSESGTIVDTGSGTNGCTTRFPCGHFCQQSKEFRPSFPPCNIRVDKYYICTYIMYVVYVLRLGLREEMSTSPLFS
jgi:hypothetical protein